MLIKGVKVTTKWGLKNIKKKTQREREREIVFLISFLSLLIPRTSGKKYVCHEPSHL